MTSPRGIRRLPYPRWLIALLRPLNNRYTWRLRLRILMLMDPPWFKRIPYREGI